jgi:hypothetical protein
VNRDVVCVPSPSDGCSVNWATLAELLGPAGNDPEEVTCQRREEAVHRALDAAGVPRGALSVSGRVYYLLEGRAPPEPGGPAADEPQLVAERRKEANDAHEAWVAPMRKRWRARDDAEELYLRRASEMSAHQMLDQAGIPHGELSLNGRIAKALHLRYASAGSDAEDARPAKSQGKLGEVRALLRTLPRETWPITSSGLSLDVGDVRVRFEGGSRDLRLALARWFSMSRAVAESVLGRTKR